MQKIDGENKLSPRSLDMKNIIILLILFILILSLVTNFLMLRKLAKIPDGMHFHGLHSDREGYDVETNQQALEPVLQLNPVLYEIMHLHQQIINREVIKDDCLINIPIEHELKEDIKEYNKLVSKLKGFFAERAIRTLIGVFELKNKNNGEYYKPNALNYLEIPSDVREYAERIAELSLYKNCTELLCNDSRLAFIISVEGGGSAGLWPYLWHTEYLRDYDNIKEDLSRLFDLVERIITSLQKEYENIYYIKMR